MRIRLNGKLNLLHEFEDRKLEQEYARAQIIQTLHYMRKLTFGLGIAFFLFIIADYILNSQPSTVLFILANRTLICLCAFGLYWGMGVSKRYELFYYFYNLTILIASVSFYLICISYEHPNFLIQTMGLFGIILVIFMVPNRWIYKVSVSTVVAAAFLVIMRIANHDISLNDYLASVVYTALVVVLRAVSTYKNEAQRRLLYLNGRQLEILSKTDSMTGLYNRETLGNDLENRIAQVDSLGSDFGIVLFDIDDFKIINDTYGHLTGDRVLLEIVNLIEGVLPEECSMYRWGGEEFIVLFSDCALHNCVEHSKRFCDMIDQLMVENIGVTCSFGVACFHPGDTIETLLARADKNLYEAKRSGKNCVVAQEVRCEVCEKRYSPIR